MVYNYFMGRTFHKIFKLLLLLLLIPLLLLLIFCFICYLMYASNVRAVCILITCNDGSKAPIRLSGRGRSCLTFARSGRRNFFACSTKFPFRNNSGTWKRGYSHHWYVQKNTLVGVDIRDYVKEYNFNLYVCF